MVIVIREWESKKLHSILIIKQFQFFLELWHEIGQPKTRNTRDEKGKARQSVCHSRPVVVAEPHDCPPTENKDQGDEEQLQQHGQHP